MKKIVSMLVLLVTLLSVSMPVPAAAQVDVFNTACSGVTNNPVCDAHANGKGLFGSGSLWSDILNVISYVGGAIAVIVIILAGIRYITSNGNASTISSAKNAIIYASIGLAIIVLANTIINFVLGNL